MLEVHTNAIVNHAALDDKPSETRPISLRKNAIVFVWYFVYPPNTGWFIYKGTPVILVCAPMGAVQDAPADR